MAKVKKETEELVDDMQGIEVGDPQILRPKELPLVVKLPEDASEAQIQYAKTLNAYAYQNPEKWAAKKDVLIERLKSLKNAPAPKESNLKVNDASL